MAPRVSNNSLRAGRGAGAAAVAAVRGGRGAGRGQANVQNAPPLPPQPAGPSIQDGQRSDWENELDNMQLPPKERELVEMFMIKNQVTGVENREEVNTTKSASQQTMISNVTMATQLLNMKSFETTYQLLSECVGSSISVNTIKQLAKDFNTMALFCGAKFEHLIRLSPEGVLDMKGCMSGPMRALYPGGTVGSGGAADGGRQSLAQMEDDLQNGESMNYSNENFKEYGFMFNLQQFQIPTPSKGFMKFAMRHWSSLLSTEAREFLWKYNGLFQAEDMDDGRYNTKQINFELELLEAQQNLLYESVMMILRSLEQFSHLMVTELIQRLEKLKQNMDFQFASPINLPTPLQLYCKQKRREVNIGSTAVQLLMVQLKLKTSTTELASIAEVYAFRFIPTAGCMVNFTRFRRMVDEAKAACFHRTMDTPHPALSNNEALLDVFKEAIITAVASGDDFSGYDTVLNEYKSLLSELETRELHSFKDLHSVIIKFHEERYVQPFADVKSPVVMSVHQQSGINSKRAVSCEDDSIKKQVGNGTKKVKFTGNCFKCNQDGHRSFECPCGTPSQCIELLNEFLQSNGHTAESFWFCNEDGKKYLKSSGSPKKLYWFTSDLWKLASSEVKGAFTVMKGLSLEFYGIKGRGGGHNVFDVSGRTHFPDGAGSSGDASAIVAMDAGQLQQQFQQFQQFLAMQQTNTPQPSAAVNFMSMSPLASSQIRSPAPGGRGSGM